MVLICWSCSSVWVPYWSHVPGCHTPQTSAFSLGSASSQSWEEQGNEHSFDFSLLLVKPLSLLIKYINNNGDLAQSLQPLPSWPGTSSMAGFVFQAICICSLGPHMCVPSVRCPAQANHIQPFGNVIQPICDDAVTHSPQVPKQAHSSLVDCGSVPFCSCQFASFLR